MKKRRLLLISIGTGVLAVSLAARSQQTLTKVPRIVILTPGSGMSPPIEAFRKGLAELGYVEGQSITLEYRFAAGRLERLPEFARELVDLKVDVIVSGSTEAIQAVRRLSAGIPIVMGSISDPVGSGLIASLGRPGGNTTGLTLLSPELAGKRLELLREIFPRVRRMAVLVLRDNPPAAVFIKETEAAAQRYRLLLKVLPIRRSEDLDIAFSAIVQEGFEAVILQNNNLFDELSGRIAELALDYRLPAIYTWSKFPRTGGLIAYGPNVSDLWRRAATYVDKILNGAKPADLPVEQPTKFELVINMRTAKALGITIPQSVLLRADELIQ